MQKKIYRIFLITFLILLSDLDLFSQQIPISRIERMPNHPKPYLMRNWKQVAMGYDTLVFDLNRTGQYLPLVWTDNNGLNYPNHPRFGLHTIVGTPYPSSAEGINVLPAVISASLAGVDKRNQNGQNWVLMSEEFFNKRPEENVYLNNPTARSGSDWWYDTMPNVFFYQLYDLYPNTGDFEYQFKMVADRWLEAVKRMGASTTPWKAPNMNYRAWSLSTMKPLSEGVKEPEAAGAIGWLLYNAYLKTGNPEYRIGAEWCLEFLNNFDSNPFYELQLPYGVYVAARMNAELGTNYNIQKMLDWCFTTDGNVRNWGATLGKWGDYDCAGLIGEAKFAGYAFAMNGFEQAGALVPMVRYDERFARAIGKWMLNLANASRLFYSKYLPDDRQDNEDWAKQYDPHAYIAYEALRQYALHTGVSPYATGDFMRNNWGPTNLSLYGSSHVGILGGIIDTTNVPEILQLDVLKTDYFGNEAFPTYLYFNPYDEAKFVEIQVGGAACDLYDAITNQFLAQGANGTATFSIPSNSAVLLVLLPTGGQIAYEGEWILVNGIIADYHSGDIPENYPPRIKSLAASPLEIMIESQVMLYCAAEDRDNPALEYTWKVVEGTITGTGKQVSWKAPAIAGIYPIQCIVRDGAGASDTAQVVLKVIDNRSPVIEKINAVPNPVDFGEMVTLTCFARDPDLDTLKYKWKAIDGELTTNKAQAFWTAPAANGVYYVSCQVVDRRGASTVDSVGIVVGKLVLHLPCDGNSFDISGFGNNGTPFGPVLVPDPLGKPDGAYYFDGLDDYIKVLDHPSLNFQEAITVSFWMRLDEYFDREAYPISHGNWENRWKISITPGTNMLRWTVKSTDGVKDLDTKAALLKNVFYYVTTVYDGKKFEIYLNGELNASTTFSGQILQTPIDLTLGQVLPNNNAHNFKGVLDDIRIYNQALPADEIRSLYKSLTGIETTGNLLPENFALLQNFPNPFNSQTTIRYQLKNSSPVKIKIYDLLGQEVRLLLNQNQPAGFHTVNWNAENNLGVSVASGIYIYEMQAENFQQKRKLIFLK